MSVPRVVELQWSESQARGTGQAATTGNRLQVSALPRVRAPLRSQARAVGTGRGMHAGEAWPGRRSPATAWLAELPAPCDSQPLYSLCLQEKYKRALADTENLRQRSQKLVEEAKLYGQCG